MIDSVVVENGRGGRCDCEMRCVDVDVDDGGGGGGNVARGDQRGEGKTTRQDAVMTLCWARHVVFTRCATQLFDGGYTRVGCHVRLRSSY